MLLLVSAVARFGLSRLCWGRILVPECSPVTSSFGRIGSALLVANRMLSAIWELISDWLTHTTLPEASVRQRHGMTVKSCWQPRYGCE